MPPVMHRSSVVLALGALALSCASSDTSKSTSPEFAFEASLPDGVARPPSTAEEIARAHPPGTFTLYRLSESDAQAFLQRTEWVEATDDGCTMTVTAMSEDGTPLGEPQTRSAKWWQLRNHAVFPEQAVTITSDSVSIEAGDFDCSLYEVDTPGPDGVAGRMRMWFDEESAGSPVLFISEAGGRVASRMELVDTNRRTR